MQSNGDFLDKKFVIKRISPLSFILQLSKPLAERAKSNIRSFALTSNLKEENIEQLIKDKNFKYKIKGIGKINSFELESLNLRSYYHNHILAFGDLLHSVHPLAGQGFNMTIRDTKIFLDIIENKYSLGLNLDSSVNYEFEKKLKHKNFIFSNGIDLVHEFFNFERKTNTSFLSKSVQLLNKNPQINKMFTEIADKGTLL